MGFSIQEAKEHAKRASQEITRATHVPKQPDEVHQEALDFKKSRSQLAFALLGIRSVGRQVRGKMGLLPSPSFGARPSKFQTLSNFDTTLNSFRLSSKYVRTSADSYDAFLSLVSSLDQINSDMVRHFADIGEKDGSRSDVYKAVMLLHTYSAFVILEHTMLQLPARVTQPPV